MRRSLKFAGLLLCAGIVTSALAYGASACNLDVRPTVLASAGDPREAGSRLFQVWDLEESAAFYGTTRPRSKGYDAFRRDLDQSGLATDVPTLLKSGAKKGETAADVANRVIALQGAGEWIHPANCLEMLLVGMQNDRMPILMTSTEFVAMLLRSADGRRLRIYHYAKNQEGFGNVSELLDPIARDHRDGWAVIAALHNHNFRMNEGVSSGVLAPSAADAQLQRRLTEALSLQEAWITNGINTIRIPAAEFGRFHAAE